MDSRDPYEDRPQSETGGLEPAITVPMAEAAGHALSSLHQAGARLAVTVDGNGRPYSVVPAKTLAAAPPGQQAASCKPAWPASTFDEPTNTLDAQRLAADPPELPPAGHRTVVLRDGQLMGVLPVPGLIARPGRISKILERLLMAITRLTMAVRYGRYRTLRHRGGTRGGPS